MKTSALVRFRPRTLFVLSLTSAISAFGFIWPFLIKTTSIPVASILFWAASAFAIALVIIEISNDSLDAKSIALLGVLTAIVAALRPLGAGAVGIEPMWFVLILSARVFGSSFGFILGLTSILTSALLTGGIGPWLGYQLFAAGWIGLFAGWLPKKIRGKPEIFLLVLYAIAASFIFSESWFLFFSDNFLLSFIWLESSRISGDHSSSGSQMTAAVTREPQRDPRPTSSSPASIF